MGINDNTAVYSASSQGPKGLNQDGSRNVYCWKCLQFICRTNQSFSRAICEICRRSEAGELITEQLLTDYDLGKSGQTYVTNIVIREEIKQEPRKDRSLKSMGNGLLQAIGIKLKIKKPAQSVQTSKGKRLKPLFSETEMDDKQ